MHKKYYLVRTYLRKIKCNLISISILQSQCHNVRLPYMRFSESSDYVYLLGMLFAVLVVLFFGTNKVKYWQMRVEHFSKPLYVYRPISNIFECSGFFFIFLHIIIHFSYQCCLSTYNSNIIVFRQSFYKT